MKKREARSPESIRRTRQAVAYRRLERKALKNNDRNAGHYRKLAEYFERMARSER